MRSNTYPTQGTVHDLLGFLDDIPFGKRVAGDTVAETKEDLPVNRIIPSAMVFARLVMQVVKDSGVNY